MALVLVAGSVGVLLASAKPAGADTVFQAGQVFASVGNSTVNVYDPSSGNLLSSLVDNTGEPYTVGTAFDEQGDLYVADDVTGDISEFNSNGAPMPTFATGLSNPLSMVFDNQGNMYVGQQTTPYIAEFAPDGTRLGDIGPLQTELYGDDWIDLASDECTFYYTSEGTDIETYNKCTNTQGPNFNKVPFPTSDPTTGDPVNAFQLKILSDGDVLVADSDAVLLLDPNGNVVHSYACSGLPNCFGQLFAVNVDPSGTSFWTADSLSGEIYQINIDTGALMSTIPTHSGLLFGLSVLGNLEVATPPAPTTSPSTLTIQPVTGDFSTPTPVSAVLTNPDTTQPIANEPITFTLNGNSNESCTATTDATGTATCDITANEPSNTYTLTASFPGDSTTAAPIGSDSTSSSFTVNPDTSSVDYTGPTTGMNGQPITLTGTLTTDVPSADTPLPTKVVTFTVGSGSTAQSCNAVTDVNGDVGCTIPSLLQPTSDVSITTSFSGDNYDSPVTSTTPAVVSDPTSLLVNAATGDYSDGTQVSGVLTDLVSNQPIPGEPVVLTLNGTEACTGTTDATGTASCFITPGEPAATYPLTGGFGGDATHPLQLLPSTGSANFVVTLEETELTYTGGTVAQNGQPLTVSGVLTSDDGSTPLPGQPVTFTLGSGPGAQTCAGTTDPTGAASCTIQVTDQSPGPIPVLDTFGGTAYFQSASASSTVNLPEGTALTVRPGSGIFDTPTTLTGTLVNTYTTQPVPNEPVTLTVNGSQSCTGTTNTSGVATCTVTPTEPAGTYSLTGTFGGDSGTMPQLEPTSGSNTVTVTAAPTTLTYTGTTTVTNGQNATLSGVLTANVPVPGSSVSGRTVTFTLGSGSELQSCTAVTAANGAASCTITGVNQTTGTSGISASFSGDNFYQSSTAASTATVHTPTTLTVSAGTSDYSDAGTVTGTLTNSITGAPLPGEPVTLTLNGTQSCAATTNAHGAASCSITPNEPAGTYSVTGSFGGDTTKAPQLLASTGSNNYIVTLEETSIAYTGSSIAVSGMTFTMSATLTTDGSPLAGRPVLMTLGSGSTAQSCTGTTTAAGSASCTIANVNQIAGSVPITVTFAGDAYYRPASASGTETTAAPPSGGGGFVVGDVSAGKPTIGTQVNFWGSQLWKTNQFSGVNNAPASMKGYIDNAPNYACGAAWTSNTGNSSNPPSTIPVNVVIVVASSITQSGSTESGNIEHLVVVSAASGYGPAPGHDGDGKIIATLC